MTNEERFKELDERIKKIEEEINNSNKCSYSSSIKEDIEESLRKFNYRRSMLLNDENLKYLIKLALYILAIYAIVYRIRTYRLLFMR